MNIDKIISLDEGDLKDELKLELIKLGYDPIDEKGFLYADGEVPVLLVAHLDTVHKDLVTIICKSEDGRFIMSPSGVGGDDRCGVYMILEIIKELKCSVLFTEQEEVGNVGAKLFCKSKVVPQANYIIEFDRKGDKDAVFYNCTNDKFIDFIIGGGFKKEFGTSSDIKDIAPHLNIAAVNLSSGYYNAHNIGECIDMLAMQKIIEKTKELIKTPQKVFSFFGKKKPQNDIDSSFGENFVKINKRLMPINLKEFSLYGVGMKDVVEDIVYIDAEESIYVKRKNKLVMNPSLFVLNASYKSPKFEYMKAKNMEAYVTCHTLMNYRYSHLY